MEKKVLKEKLRVFLMIMLYIFGMTLINFIDIKLRGTKQNKKNQKKIVEHINDISSSKSKKDRYNAYKSKNKVGKRRSGYRKR